MALPKVKDARALSEEDLSQAILDTKKKLANLRVLKATGRLEKTHEFKHARHWLAQLLTVEGERQREATAPETAPDPETVAPSEPSTETSPEEE